MATVDVERCVERLRRLYSHMQAKRVDYLAISTPENPEQGPDTQNHECYSKSSVLTSWVFGRVIWPSIMVFNIKQLHCLCTGPVEFSILNTIREPVHMGLGVEVVVHLVPENEDGHSLMDAILGSIQVRAVVGYIANDAQHIKKGRLIKVWNKKLKSSEFWSIFKLIDVANELSQLFAVKDFDEIMKISKSAYFCNDVMRHFVMQKLDDMIRSEEKVSHRQLRDLTLTAIVNPSNTDVVYTDGLSRPLRGADEYDFACFPYFHSGGISRFHLGATCSRKSVEYDAGGVLICSLGTRFENYCSAIARTFIVDATHSQARAYQVLLKAHEAAISALKPFNTVSAAYQAALHVVRTNAPELENMLSTHVGSGIGLELFEPWLSISEGNNIEIKESMVFKVSVGFERLRSNQKDYSLLLIDTVIANNIKPIVLTSCTRDIDALRDSHLMKFESGIHSAKEILRMVKHIRFEELAESEFLRREFVEAANLLLATDGALSSSQMGKVESVLNKLDESVELYNKYSWMRISDQSQTVLNQELLVQWQETHDLVEEDKKRIEELKAQAYALEMEENLLFMTAAEHQATLDGINNNISKLEEELEGLESKMAEISRLL